MRVEIVNISAGWISILRLLIWLPAMVLPAANGEDDDQEEEDGPNTKTAYLVEEYAPWALASLIGIMLGCYCCYQFRMATLARTDEEQDHEEGRKHQAALKIEQTNDINGSDGRYSAQRKQDFRGVGPLSKRPSDYSITDRTDRLSVDGSPASSLSGRPSSHGKVLAGSSSSLVTDLGQQLPSIIDEDEDQSSVRQQDGHSPKQSATVPGQP